MLDQLREFSITVWKPIGELFSSISESSNTWFPIIAYILLSVLSLIFIKKILDLTVSSLSSLSIKIIWAFLKKLILYTVIIGMATTIIVSLFFYFESLYTSYDKESQKSIERKQSVDYLLLK